MNITSRRTVLAYAARFIALTGAFGFLAALAQSPKRASADDRAAPGSDATVEEWMNDWMQTKALSGPLYLSRFVEPIYFLIQSIRWTPNPGQPHFESVDVPKGFVTDLASIPRLFWSALRPDGEYAHAAIVHDYLYWAQSTSKETADSIFKLAMEDLEVAPRTVTALYDAVKLFGEGAWKQNAKLKAQGERRILKRFPSDARARWSDWKTRPDVFI